MKLLLCVASLKQIDSLLSGFAATLTAHPHLSFIASAKILHHEVDILETGSAVFQTSYKVTKALSLQKYHLALKLSLGNSYHENIPVGSVLNVVNEKPGDFGTQAKGGWNDLYDLGLLNRDEYPHQRGGFINLNNSYMNVFMPFKKVVGLTVNHLADKEEYLMKKEKYKADCETMDGLGFVYPCLFEKQNFYHLCVVERNLATGIEETENAKQVLNDSLTDILNKL